MFFSKILKIIRIISLITFMAVYALRGTAIAQNPKTLLRVCRGNTDFLPYMSLKGDGKWQLLIRNAIAHLPIEVVIHQVPRGRCVVEVQNNSQSDAFFGVPSPELRPTVSFPVNSQNEIDKSFIIDSLSYYVVVHKNSDVNWDGQKFSNLQNLALGVQRGRKYITDVLDEKNIPYDTAFIEQNFDKLKTKRIAGIIIESQQYEELKKKHPDYDFKVLPTVFLITDIYLGVSTPYYKKNKALVDQLWHNMKTLRKP